MEELLHISYFYICTGCSGTHSGRLVPEKVQYATAWFYWRLRSFFHASELPIHPSLARSCGSCCILLSGTTLLGDHPRMGRNWHKGGSSTAQPGEARSFRDLLVHAGLQLEKRLQYRDVQRLSNQQLRKLRLEQCLRSKALGWFLCVSMLFAACWTMRYGRYGSLSSSRRPRRFPTVLAKSARWHFVDLIPKIQEHGNTQSAPLLAVDACSRLLCPCPCQVPMEIALMSVLGMGWKTSLSMPKTSYVMHGGSNRLLNHEPWWLEPRCTK